MKIMYNTHTKKRKVKMGRNRNNMQTKRTTNEKKTYSLNKS